jgi:hypothetical protein
VYYGSGDCVGMRVYEVGDGDELHSITGLYRGECM